MQKDRKKEHKKVVKEIRRRNKQISEDAYIGLNRFRIDMYSESCHRYSDNSGVRLYFILKLTDKWTDNTAYFLCNNYNFSYKIVEYANDFLIRCSSGHSGSWPHLHYVAYDVHEVIPYEGRKDNPTSQDKYEDGVIDFYDWLSR